MTKSSKSKNYLKLIRFNSKSLSRENGEGERIVEWKNEKECHQDFVKKSQVVEMFTDVRGLHSLTIKGKQPGFLQLYKIVALGCATEGSSYLLQPEQ